MNHEHNLERMCHQVPDSPSHLFQFDLVGNQLFRAVGQLNCSAHSGKEHHALHIRVHFVLVLDRIK